MGVVVTPVPPLPAFKAPDKVTAPEVATFGVNPVVPALNDVTPVEEIEILPAPLMMLIPLPAVSVPTPGAAPVSPIRSCPFVGGEVVASKPDVPEYKNAFVANPPTVREVVTVTEEGSDTVIAPVDALTVI